MNNADKPAYPRSGYEHSNLADNVHYYHEDGLTKREMFAMAAMQGIVSSYEVQKDLQDDARFTGGNFADVVALNAIEFADALLKQLESSKPKN